MGVQKFVKRPDKLDGIKFVGGASNGTEIVNWVVSSGGTALWLDAMEPIIIEGEGVVFPGRAEGLRLVAPSGQQTAAVGDYIVKELTGEFKAVKAAEFEAKYEPTGGPSV